MKKFKIIFRNMMALMVMPFMLLSCASDGKMPVNVISIKQTIKGEDKKLESVYKDKENKHYFLIMVDSLISFRLMDTITMLKKYKAKLKPIGQYDNLIKKKVTQQDIDIIDEKLAFFNEFELKMNVIAPSHQTSGGLQGLVGGAFGSVITSEFMRPKDQHRIYDLNSAWLKLLYSIGTSDNIDKIYLQTMQFFNGQSLHDRFNVDWNLSNLDIPDKAKNKIDLSFFNKDNYMTNSHLVNIVANTDTSKNTFTFLNTNVIHDDYGWWTYGIGNLSDLKSSKLFNLFTLLKRKLVEKGIWDKSEIMIVSDHGKSSSRANEEIFSALPFNGAYRDNKIKMININHSDDNGKKTITTGKLKSFSKVWESPLLKTYSSILHKRRFSKNKQLKLDYKNVYTNFDAIAQLYHNMGVDTSFIEFDYLPFIDGLKNKKNTNGDFNSFVANPFGKDLSQRRVIAFWPNQYNWGYYRSMFFTNRGYVFSGPWWKLGADGKPVFDGDAITRIYLDDKHNGSDPNDRLQPWLDVWREEAIKSGVKNGGFKIIGLLFDAIHAYLNRK